MESSKGTDEPIALDADFSACKEVCLGDVLESSVLLCVSFLELISKLCEESCSSVVASCASACVALTPKYNDEATSMEVAPAAIVETSAWWVFF